MRTGLHRTYLGGIERGERNPTWKTLATIAAGLGVSLSQLVKRAEDEARNGDAPDAHAGGRWSRVPGRGRTGRMTEVVCRRNLAHSRSYQGDLTPTRG